jgi:hypothetical protein
MVWTALSYNPVRILGLLGLAGMAVAGLVFLGLLVARLSGVTSLGPSGVIALFTALISAVVGINLFALGVTFNYLVSLFYKKPIRQGLFGKPIFKTPLDQQFGWIGVLAVLAGIAIGLISLALGVGGWPIERLWFYLLGSALSLLVGVQLVVYWLLVRVLDELNQREFLTKQDMGLN